MSQFLEIVPQFLEVMSQSKKYPGFPKLFPGFKKMCPGVPKLCYGFQKLYPHFNICVNIFMIKGIRSSWVTQFPENVSQFPENVFLCPQNVSWFTKKKETIFYTLYFYHKAFHKYLEMVNFQKTRINF